MSTPGLPNQHEAQAAAPAPRIVAPDQRVASISNRVSGIVRRHRTMMPLLLAVSFLVLALVFTWPLFEQPQNWGIRDWDQHLFYQAVPRTTLLDFGQLPLWNPYLSGGFPALANPQSRFLFPSFLLVLGFGVVWGVKLEVLLHYFVGLAGGYVVARAHGLGRAAAVVVAAVYMLSGMVALAITAGMTTFLAAALIPWLLWAYRRAPGDVRWSLVAGALLALVFFDGGAHLVPLVAVFLLVYTATDLARDFGRWRAALVNLALTFGSAALFAAVKLLPAVALLQRFPRRADEYSGYSLVALWDSWLSTRQHITDPLPANVRGFVHGMSWDWDENGMYVGGFAIALAAVGVAARWRRQLPLAVSLVLLLWLALGDRAPVSLWALLHELPVFDGMRVAQRFRYLFMLCLALFAGVGFEVLRAHARRSALPVWLQRSALGLLFVLTVLPLVRFNSDVLRDAFPIPPVEVGQPARFRQAVGMPTYDRDGLRPDRALLPLGAWSGMYPAVRANIGTIDGYEPMTDGFASPTTPFDSPAYRGELFVVGDGTATITSWSPNRVVARLELPAPATVVLNQNYLPGWRTRAGDAVIDHEGLVAVPLGSGATRLELYYRPASFVVGAVVSTTSALLAVLYCWHYRRRRRDAA